MITPGDVDDRKPLDYKPFVEFLYGKLVGDKGYIGKELFQRLFVDTIQLFNLLGQPLLLAAERPTHIVHHLLVFIQICFHLSCF